jgi:hypothetical protein
VLAPQRLPWVSSKGTAVPKRMQDAIARLSATRVRRRIARTSRPDTLRRGTLLTLALLSVGIGCVTGDSMGPGSDVTLPPSMTLIAAAAGHDDGIDVECELDLTVTLERVGGRWIGDWGGEAQRKAADPTGAGVSYFADAHSELHAHVSGAGEIALESWREGVRLEPDGTSRFWDGILRLRGHLVPGGDPVVAAGEWRCEPMDTHADRSGTVAGTWELRR